MKVYCKNCKWFKRKILDVMPHTGAWCINRDCYYKEYIGTKIYIEKSTGLKFKEKVFETPETIISVLIKKHLSDYHSIINKNNRCKYYKRIWWKFWVKEQENE